MKIGSIERKNGSTTHKLSTTLFAVLSLFTLILPQTAHAGFKERFFAFAPIFDKAIVEDTEETETPKFPVAEARTPIRTIRVVTTAYSSDPAQTDDTPCIPANGEDLCKMYEERGYGDTVANNCLPLGTQVLIPELFGDKVFVVRDRMNKRYGCERMDVWMPEKAEARTHGVKVAKAEVLGRIRKVK